MSYAQESRICQIVACPGLDDVVVRRFSGREAISEPFRFDLEVVSRDPEVDLAPLLGASITFGVMLSSGGMRSFNGVVDQVGHLEDDLTSAIYHLQLVPWTRLLELRSNCRVFQEMAVPDIVEAVLADHSARDYVWRLEGDYRQRGLCVQYRESDWDFVARLLEEEGIAYHFEHENDHHVLVFCDSAGQRLACPDQPTALFRTAQDADSSPSDPSQEMVQEFRLERSLTSGRCLLADFNYLDPGASLEAGASADLAAEVNRELEDYEYPGGFVKLGAEDDPKLPFGETLAGLRAEALDALTVHAYGETDCRGFQAGFTFELENHLRQDCLMAWLLLEVHHELDQSGTLSTTAGGRPSYRNTIVCMPADLPFRPARRTARPVVKGPQTAFVTGPQGEEIHTDKHGRIKVAFHWDRYGRRDGSDSCWVRVAHGWAGAGWGAQFTPRIGQEVVVEFLEGDPDRPLVTGSVYNGKNTIPFETPTQSGIRTRSSKEGSAANCNEIRFEDKKDEEDLFIQAERTMTINVKQAATTDIGTDETVTVGRNRSATIEENDSTAVGQDQDVSVNGNRTLAVENDQVHEVKGNDSHSVGGDEVIDVTGDTTISATKIILSGSSAVRLEVGGSYIEITAGGVTINGAKLEMEGSAEAGLSAPLVKINGDMSTEISGTMVKMEGSATTVIKGGVVQIN
jgi:type VI secretion system secreted protein VgrG